ncbi:MAG: hypothetical protein K2G19_11490 [Lachnospiraceae bacterium]|nr:hypothetical protein [Lachnospiraceae bacterium]
MERFRRFLQEKIILGIVLCILLGVVLATASTAWYAVNSSVRTYGIELKAGGTGGIKVAASAGGEDIMLDESLPLNEEGVPVLSIALKDFENIESGRIAPGAYIPMDFYITALGENIKSYSIKVQMEYKPADENITQEQKKKIEEMINDHIQVYQTMYEEDGIIKFSDPLTFYKEVTDEVETARGPLIFNQEVLAQIYWVWNYELTDIPDYENMERFQRFRGPDGFDVRGAVRATMKKILHWGITLTISG